MQIHVSRMLYLLKYYVLLLGISNTEYILPLYSQLRGIVSSKRYILLHPIIPVPPVRQVNFFVNFWKFIYSLKLAFGSFTTRSGLYFLYRICTNRLYGNSTKMIKTTLCSFLKLWKRDAWLPKNFKKTRGFRVYQRRWTWLSFKN